MTNNDPRFKIIPSIRYYLMVYKDTSKTKTVRLAALQSAKQIIEYLLNDVIAHMNEHGTGMLWSSFKGIIEIIENAQNNQNELYDVSNAIGFLNILESANINNK